MKFVVLALVAAAAAEPEADSQFYSYAAPTAYSTTYNRAFPYSAYFPYSNFYSHAFPYSYATHHMTKRDAEAEPRPSLRTTSLPGPTPTLRPPTPTPTTCCPPSGPSPPLWSALSPPRWSALSLPPC